MNSKAKLLIAPMKAASCNESARIVIPARAAATQVTLRGDEATPPVRIDGRPLPHLYCRGCSWQKTTLSVLRGS